MNTFKVKYYYEKDEDNIKVVKLSQQEINDEDPYYGIIYFSDEERTKSVFVKADCESSAISMAQEVLQKDLERSQEKMKKIFSEAFAKKKQDEEDENCSYTVTLPIRFKDREAGGLYIDEFGGAPKVRKEEASVYDLKDSSAIVSLGADMKGNFFVEAVFTRTRLKTWICVKKEKIADEDEQASYYGLFLIQKKLRDMSSNTMLLKERLFPFSAMNNEEADGVIEKKNFQYNLGDYVYVTDVGKQYTTHFTAMGTLLLEAYIKHGCAEPFCIGCSLGALEDVHERIFEVCGRTYTKNAFGNPVEIYLIARQPDISCRKVNEPLAVYAISAAGLSKKR